MNTKKVKKFFNGRVPKADHPIFNYVDLVLNDVGNHTNDGWKLEPNVRELGDIVTRKPDLIMMTRKISRQDRGDGHPRANRAWIRGNINATMVEKGWRGAITQIEANYPGEGASIPWFAEILNIVG